MISYSEAQALALITDPGTLKRGQELLKPTKWANLGRTETAAWGDCAGSGSKPYLTGIDLTEPAFKCSCPSRVFPCKHGAGLLLLMARQPALFGAGTPPAWLSEWLEKRQHSQEKKPVKPAPDTAAVFTAKASGDTSAIVLFQGEKVPSGSPSLLEKGPGDEVASVGGIAVDPKRLARMVAGTEDLVAWLEDLLRAGLAALDKQPARYWESQGARLVDNQLPGLAATVRELATLRHAHVDWPAHLLGRLGELYLLARAFLNLPGLVPEARADVLQQVGVNLKKEDLLATAAPVADSWRVLGQFRWEEERLTARRTWLHGRNTGRTALVLEFSFGSQPFATPLILQGSYVGELAFYPGLLPLRAAPLSLKFDGTVPPEVVPPGQSIGQLLDDYANALARQPWLREWPATLAQVLPVRQADGQWQLHHATEPLTLPLRFADENAGWQLLAESGGQPITLFGEWDGRAFRPLSNWLNTLLGAPTLWREEPNNITLIISGSHSQPDAADKLDAGPPLQEFREVNGPQLLRVALLGTRQSGEAIPVFPRLAPSAEQQLLLAAGTLAFMRKAGHQPPAPTTAPPAPAPAETWVPLGPTGAECLRALLNGNRFTGFRTDYIALLQAQQRTVPPALLVPVLNHKDFRLHLPGDTSAILGERGRWLARQNPDWQALVAPVHPSKDLATWETGDLRARRFFIQLLHQADPSQARELLAAVLPTEPAATQAALLSELEHTVTAADAPLLETYLTAKSKEVRQTVLPLLARLPGAPVLERLWQRAAPLLSVQRPLLRRAKLQIALPDGWDKTWLADGIEQHDTSFEGGQRAAWLGQMLTLLPPGRWAAHLDLTPEELLTLAEASEWKLLLLRAWARAAFLHQDKAFAAPLLLRHFHQPNWLHHQQATHLTWVLSDDEKIALLRAQLKASSPALPAFLPEFLKYIFAPWPPDLVAAALRYVAEVLAPAITNPYGEPHQRLSSLFYRLERYAPTTLASHCAETLHPVAEAHPLVAPLIDSFNEGLVFRQRLHTSLTEPAE
ncbi:DUF5691 domain-containing protein [Hymenobacter sp. UYCo722]|uniref:DUF5691 domain-containing protein n=1 Tax=Hymenobacter sp. UYCo722 TaxID=3156335 RepID=UPI0033949E54